MSTDYHKNAARLNEGLIGKFRYQKKFMFTGSIVTASLLCIAAFAGVCLFAAYSLIYTSKKKTENVQIIADSPECVSESGSYTCDDVAFMYAGVKYPGSAIKRVTEGFVWPGTYMKILVKNAESASPEFEEFDQTKYGGYQLGMIYLGAASAFFLLTAIFVGLWYQRSPTYNMPWSSAGGYLLTGTGVGSRG